MIVVTVEIWPYGEREARRIIGQLTVANAGRAEADKEICRYIAKQYEPAEGERAIQNVVVPRHDRRDGVWVLLQKALSALT